MQLKVLILVISFFQVQPIASYGLFFFHRTSNYILNHWCKQHALERKTRKMKRRSLKKGHQYCFPNVAAELRGNRVMIRSAKLGPQCKALSCPDVVFAFDSSLRYSTNTYLVIHSGTQMHFKYLYYL